jgi:polysaccharide export outer membrane protein
MNKLLAVLLLPVLLISCKSSKEAVDQYRYFDKNMDTLNTLVNQMKEPKILEGDMLDIQVYSGSLNQEQVKVFTLESETTTGYVVDVEGNIHMPVLGKINVTGLDKPGLEKLLVEKLEPYVKNPVVNILFLNFKVLAIGEVTRQGFQTMTAKSSVLDVIGQAGGFTDFAARTDVTLIRQMPGGKRRYTHFNFNDAAIFASPDFQVQQNDILYVQPNNSKMVQYERANNPLFRDLPVYLALVSSIIAFITLIVAFRN